VRPRLKDRRDRLVGGQVDFDSLVTLRWGGVVLVLWHGHKAIVEHSGIGPDTAAFQGPAVVDRDVPLSLRGSGDHVSDRYWRKPEHLMKSRRIVLPGGGLDDFLNQLGMLDRHMDRLLFVPPTG